VAGSVLIYAALAFGFVGTLALVRPLSCLYLPTRRHAATVLGLAALLFVAAALLPAPNHRVPTPLTRLDEFIPTWQFAERHEIRVQARPDQVEEAVRQVTAREIRLFRLLTWIRRPRLPTTAPAGDILAPSPDKPILDVALGSGFFLLAEERNREVVFGTIVIAPAGAASLPAERVRDLADPGYAKAVMNFLLTDGGNGWTLLTTETRIFATDRATARRFAVYWRLIYPGSSLIRRTWLAAIRERAEAAS